jgi:hypothetical protein
VAEEPVAFFRAGDAKFSAAFDEVRNQTAVRRRDRRGGLIHE